jgi:hypothetical protein
MGNKVKKKKSDMEIGKLIVKAWKQAAQSTAEPFVIDRRALIEDLSMDYLDTNKNTGGNNNRIVIDVVFDTDLDGETRLVWIAIPTPDTAKTKEAWEDYINRLTPAQIQQIGNSVLFGCGR